MNFHDQFHNYPIKFKIHGMFDFGGSTFQNKGGIDNVSPNCGPRDRVEFRFLFLKRKRKRKKKLINYVAMSNREYCFKRNSLITVVPFKPQQVGSKLFVHAAPSDTSLPNLSWCASQ